MDKKSFDEILKLQRSVARDLSAEVSFDARIEVINIAREICKINGLVSIEALYIEAIGNGLDESLISKIITDLIKDKFFSEQGNGYLRIID